MTTVLLGIAVTYIAAPLAAYSLISPFFRLQDDTSFLVAVIAMGFGPIGISFLLFLLFTITPGHSDLFYVGCIGSAILMVLIVQWRQWFMHTGARGNATLMQGLSNTAATLMQILSNTAAMLIKILTNTAATLMQNLRNTAATLMKIKAATLMQILSNAAGLTSTILGLVLFVLFVEDLREVRAFGAYVHFSVLALVIVIGLISLALPVLIRDSIAIARSVRELTFGMLAHIFQHTRLQVADNRTVGIRNITAQVTDNRLVLVFGATLTAILLALVLRVGLATPLTENDPLEYALMSRVIYAVKSLNFYPFLTHVPGTSLYAGGSHPPAFNLLQVWGYFFDGPNATRMLRLSPLFYFVNLILLMWALLVRYSKLAAVLGGLFVLSVPMLPYLAIISHIDPMRIYFSFLSLVLVADIIRNPYLPRVIICGMAVGFALYSHSLGAVFAFICGCAYLLLARNGWRDRFLTATLIGIVSVVVGGTQYIKNIIQFGVPLGDYEPVWRLPGLQETADLAQRRGLATPLDIIMNGIFRNFTMIDIFGPIWILALGLIICRIRSLLRGELTRVMLFACACFYTIIIISTLFGSISAIKNNRYMLGISPAFCFLAAVAMADIASSWLAQASADAVPGSRRMVERLGYYFRSPGYVMILMMVVVAWSIPVIRSRVSYSRATLVWQARDADFGYDPSFFYEPLVLYFRDVSKDDGKVLTFRQNEFGFYGRHPWINHLDPALLGFYQITDKQAAYLDLLRRGIKYFLVPEGMSLPTAYYNSQAIEIAADPNLAEIVAVTQRGAAVFRLRDRPELIPCDPVEIHLTAKSLSENTIDFNRGKAGLTSLEFSDIDVSSDATSEQSVRGMRRMHVGLDLQGEGLAEIFIKASANTVTTSTSTIWLGLVHDEVRRVNVQVVIPPRSTRLSLVVRKYKENIGSLYVHGIDLCRFQGPPVMDKNND